jgi:tetratricopeptide (TPR) repeat protein
MRYVVVSILAATVILVNGCSQESGPDSQEPSVAADVDDLPTFLARRPDEALDRILLPEAFRREQERLLAEAMAALEARPDDVEALIWAGRRLGYLARYREAVDLYSEGIQNFPEEPRLYRHRGHRFFTLRQFNRATADLEIAARLMSDQPDQVEPDGLPNERGIPTSTLQSNVWYHLGLAYYVQGEFAAARAAYREGLKVSRNPDMLSAMAYWSYLNLRRLDRHEEAAEVLLAIDTEMDIIENHDYHRMLMVFKGEQDAEELWMEARTSGSLSLATVGYGLGTWHLLNGDEESARLVWAEVLEEGQPSSFGFIAAEAEVSRLPPEASGS